MGWGDCDPSGRSTHRALWPHPWRVSGPGSLWPRLGARTVPHPSPPLPGIPPPLIPTAPPHAAEDSSDLRMFYRRCPCSSCPAPHPLRSRGVGAGGRVPPSLQDPGGWLLKLPIPPLCEPPKLSEMGPETPDQPASNPRSNGGPRASKRGHVLLPTPQGALGCPRTPSLQLNPKAS